MTSRSPAELTSGASHIAYELGQMLDAAQRIDAAKDTPTHRVLLESALLHARSLIEFLLGRGRKTDMRAEHFFPHPGRWKMTSWKRGSPSTSLRSMRISVT